MLIQVECWRVIKKRYSDGRVLKTSVGRQIIESYDIKKGEEPPFDFTDQEACLEYLRHKYLQRNNSTPDPLNPGLSLVFKIKRLGGKGLKRDEKTTFFPRTDDWKKAGPLCIFGDIRIKKQEVNEDV